MHNFTSDHATQQLQHDHPKKFPTLPLFYNYKGARHWTQISDPQRAIHSLLVASSSALALRARSPQLVASSSAARAARSSTTARRKLLCGSRCALAHHSSSQAPRWLALRAHPPQLVVASSALALRARLLGGSRCALARVVRSPATARRKLIVRWYSLMDEAESFLFLLFAADFALAAARLDPRGICLYRSKAPAFRASAPLAPQEPRSSA